MNTIRFANAIKMARIKKNLSQRELASLCDIAASSLSTYESGGKVPPLDVAARLAKVLDLSLDELCSLSVSTHEHNSLGRVIQHITELEALEPVKSIAVCSLPHSFIEVKIHFQADNADDKEWAVNFATRWNILQEMVRDRPELKEVYRTWIEKKIMEAGTFLFDGTQCDG